MSYAIVGRSSLVWSGLDPTVALSILYLVNCGCFFLIGDLIEHSSGKLKITEIEKIGSPRHHAKLYGSQPEIKRSSAGYVQISLRVG